MTTRGFYPTDLPERDPIPLWGIAAMAASAGCSLGMAFAAWWLA